MKYRISRPVEESKPGVGRCQKVSFSRNVWGASGGLPAALGVSLCLWGGAPPSGALGAL